VSLPPPAADTLTFAKEIDWGRLKILLRIKLAFADG
jgi:hypothetical protein